MKIGSNFESFILLKPGNTSEELIKIGKDGFWIRGIKVEQDSKEAEQVYNAFKKFLNIEDINKDKEEAINFLNDHAEWLEANWVITPEGREYKQKFLQSIEKLKC